MLKKILLAVVMSGALVFPVHPMQQKEAQEETNHSTIYFEKREVHASSKLGQLQLGHNGKHFFVERDGTTTIVQNAFVDKAIRNLTHDQLLWLLGRQSYDKSIRILTQKEINTINLDGADEVELSDEQIQIIDEKLNDLRTSAYLKLVQSDEGTYIIHLKPRLNGGGLFGAWAGCWAGTLAVNVGSQLLISCITIPISVVATPAVGAAVHYGITTAVAPAVAATSLAAGAAVGIAAAVATGPV